ncbi:MAG: J domain-containing protein [Thermodesulfobacteriota bacterium]
MGKRWQKIVAAREMLGLPERATLDEIKLAFRSACKLHHPDLAGNSKRNQEKMIRINEAYQTLLAYCQSYSYPLQHQDQDMEGDDEDWWMNRFGQDPLWGKKEDI